MIHVMIPRMLDDSGDYYLAPGHLQPSRLRNIDKVQTSSSKRFISLTCDPIKIDHSGYWYR